MLRIHEIRTCTNTPISITSHITIPLKYRNKQKKERILTNNPQPILPRPLPQPSPLPVKTPPLPILRRAQIQPLRRAIPRRQRHKHIPVLPSLGRRAGGFVGHDFRQSRMFLATEDVELIVSGAAAGSEVHVRGDPVAYLAPFGVVARRGVGVGEGDC